jgi:hypothetical protein
MTNETHLDSTLSLRPVQWADLNAVAKLVNEQMPVKNKGYGVNAAMLSAMETRERIQLSAADQRVFIRVQTKNKHPHSTKKHK